LLDCSTETTKKEAMIARPTLVTCLVATLPGVSALSSEALAHIRLDAPVARNVWAQAPFQDPIKDGPCGSGQDDPRSTDPAKINTFAPGETITVSWHETVDHPAHYRIAIDMDGQDDFMDPSSATDIIEPPQLPVLKDGIADTTMGTYSVDVTLPNETCDNCTLQLIQYMHDDNSSYYICADLVIEGEIIGGDGDGDGDGAGGTGTGGADGSGGDPGVSSGGSTTSSGGASTIGSGGQNQTSSGGASSTVGSGGSSADVTTDGGEQDPQAAGCSASGRGPGRGSLIGLVLGALVLSGTWSRRRFVHR
jgi:hypothetical protein